MSITQMPPRPAAVVPGTYLTGPFAPVTAEVDIARRSPASSDRP